MMCQFLIKRYIILIVITWLGASSLFSQTYFQTRAGYVHQPYKAIDPSKLDRNEHDYQGGFMIDFEIGRALKTKKLTYMFGARVQQIVEDVKGTYTPYLIDPNVNINVFRTSLFLTMGIHLQLAKKLSLQLQFCGGPKYTLWYEESKLKDTWLSWNLPWDISLEYPLSERWNLIGGTSNTMPIYTSRTHIFFCGIRKKI